MYKNHLKPILDFVFALLGTILASPVLVLTGVAVRMEDGGPVFFVQERIGREGKPFRLVKFRSMPVGSANVPSAEAVELRLTRVGGIIRRTNVDELPQLFNVILGQMSLVGPRPALPSQSNLLQMRRENGAYSCRPGLTGAAQVNSYDGMPEVEKATWDGWYARRVSFLTDVRILLSTFTYLLRPPPRY